MAVNVNVAEAIRLYESGMSIPEVSAAIGVTRSTVRARLKDAGVLRGRADGIRLAASKGRLGAGLRGKSRTFTDSHKLALREAHLERGEKYARGTRVHSAGYIEYTRGPHKGRCVHVVMMEERIGRPLFPDEVVHHIDGIKTNNDINNLVLCTRSGHTRLHRFEDALAGIERERNKDGTWS